MSTKRANTLYIIAYDIGSDKRRTKVHKILCGFGHWTQFSLFECYLSEKEYLQLRQRLEQHLNEEQDSLRFYPVCASCQNRVETVGSLPPVEPELFLI